MMTLLKVKNPFRVIIPKDKIGIDPFGLFAPTVYIVYILTIFVKKQNLFANARLLREQDARSHG
jgi:hypothetical protein